MNWAGSAGLALYSPLLCITQDLYLPDYHGLWHERLALDLDQHLKRPLLSLRSIRAGLGDPHVREARRLALCQRAEKIGAAKKNAAATATKKEIRAELEGLRESPNWADPAIDTPKVVIQGQVGGLWLWLWVAVLLVVGYSSDSSP